LLHTIFLQVAKLHEQLLKEKSFRATLEAEAGLKFPQGTSELSDIDEKVSISHSYIVYSLFTLTQQILNLHTPQTKTDFQELVLIETDLANLEWKVNELGLRLNAQLEWNYSSMQSFCDQTQQISSHEGNLYVNHYLTQLHYFS
jgi:hypothetical protein